MYFNSVWNDGKRDLYCNCCAIAILAMLYDIDCSIGVYKQQILYNAWLGLTFETLSDQNAAYSYYAKDTIAILDRCLRYRGGEHDHILFA